MNLADDGHDPAKVDIAARDGNVIHRLALQVPDGDGNPVLVDATGAIFHPWEVELLRWPSAAETALRRGGYLPGRPVDVEFWCNCAD